MWQEQKIGILGGGRLSMLLLQAAMDFGLHISVMDKDDAAPAARFASAFSKGDPMDYSAVMAFARDLDIITIETEAVNLRALTQLEASGKIVHPSSSVIGIIQDRWIQKKFLQSAGIPVSDAVPVKDLKDLQRLAPKLPAVLKRCVPSGQPATTMLRGEQDYPQALNEPCLVEEYLPVKQELSVLVSRNRSGVVECYDPVMMIYNKEKLILDFQLCPANINPKDALAACNIAAQVADSLVLIGIVSVNMFLLDDGRLLVNNIAARPHRSGLHTTAACATSQYEQHIRAMLDLPPGDTRLTAASVSMEILEPAAARRNSLRDAMRTLLGLSDAHIHMYGGRRVPGERVGHITITEDSLELALSKAVMIRHMLKHGEEAAHILPQLRPELNTPPAFLQPSYRPTATSALA